MDEFKHFCKSQVTKYLRKNGFGAASAVPQERLMQETAGLPL